MAVLLLAGFDLHGEAILLGRQRARRIGRERAWRIVGLVKVQNHLTVARQAGVEEAPGAIGFLAAGLVAEDEKQLLGIPLFQSRIEAHVPAMQAEYRVPGAVVLLGLAEDVQDGNLARLGNELGRDTIETRR